MKAAIITILIFQLDSPDFRERERATVALNRLGAEAHLHLIIAEDSGNMEVRTRSRQILDRWYAEHAREMAAAALFGKKHFPWIAETRSLGQPEALFYLEQGRRLVGIHGRPGWQDYRVATEMLVRDRLARRESLASILGLIAELETAEREWTRQNGGRFSPPVELPK